MDIKPNPNHRQYLEALARMTLEQRLKITFEMSEFGRQLFIHGLRQRFPDLPEDKFRALLLERLALCHNQNY
jgi:hypothetical protein